MNPAPPNSDPHHTDAAIAERVKANGSSAGVGAACLMFFGFWYYQLRALYVVDAFSAGEAISSYTMRIGGVILMLAALWSFAGRLPALLADAIVSVLIGVLLIVSGLLMMSGGMGINQVLYLIFGFMFASAGWRNGRDFAALSRMRSGAHGVGQARAMGGFPPHADPPGTLPTASPSAPSAWDDRPRDAALSDTPNDPAPHGGPGSLAGELRRRRAGGGSARAADEDPYAEPLPPEVDAYDATDDDAPAGESPTPPRRSSHVPEGTESTSDADAEAANPRDTDEPEDPASSESPPPGGFLSSFADDDTPRGV